MKKLIPLLIAFILVACTPATTPFPVDQDALRTAIAATKQSGEIRATLAAMPSPTPAPTLTPTPQPKDVVILMPNPVGFSCSNPPTDWIPVHEVYFFLEDLEFKFWMENGYIHGETVVRGQLIGEITSITQVPDNNNVWKVTMGFSNVSHSGRLDNLQITFYIPVCSMVLYTNYMQPAWPTE